MENIENRALSSFPSPPVFWKRYMYVDDVCCAIKRDDVAPLLQNMNSVHRQSSLLMKWRTVNIVIVYPSLIFVEVGR